MAGPFQYNFPQGDTDDLPAPGCIATLSVNDNSRPYPALIDTGAGATFIPQEIVNIFFLRPVSSLQVFGGNNPEGVRRKRYIINIEFLGFNFPNLIVTSLDKTYIVIGRDILNKYIATFDGPALQFFIDTHTDS